MGFSFESSRLLINLYAKLHKIMLCTVSETPLLAWSCLTGRGDTSIKDCAKTVVRRARAARSKLKLCEESHSYATRVIRREL